MNKLITGGNTTTERALVELVYQTLSFALTAQLQLPPYWMLIIRVVLGLCANLLNKEVPNV